MPEIVLRRIAKAYGRGAPAVSELDLVVPDGDFMCLLGPSGCGKTTTLRMIAGLEQPTGGQLRIGDTMMSDAATGQFVVTEKRRLGLVFQNYALWPHLTVQQNVMFGLRLQGLAVAERTARCAETLQMLGIAEHAARYPSQLSGGQQQRVALARTLAINPRVLLMDEPLSNLDARLRLDMRTELKRLHQRFDMTVVFVTHDQWEAMTLATSIAVMNDGRLQQIGTPEDIYDRPANRFVAEFVGAPPINIIDMADDCDLARIVGARAAPGSSIDSIGLRPEAIRLSGSAAGADSPRTEGEPDDAPIGLTVQIESVLHTGGAWLVEMRAGAVKLIADTRERPLTTAGSAARITIPARSLLFFAADGRRIETTMRTAPTVPVVRTETTNPPKGHDMKSALLLAAASLAIAGAVQAQEFDLDAMIEAAKAEPPITVYNSTSKIIGMAEAFTALYGVEATGVKVSAEDQAELVSREAMSGNIRGDVVLLSDVPSGLLELLPQGHLVNWVPPALADAIPAQFQDPLVMVNSAAVIAYNTEADDACPISNIWDLTDPEFKGRTAMQDPLNRGELTDWFNQMQTHADDAVAAAYEAKHGTPLDTSESSATEAWVEAVAANAPLLTDSDQGVSDAVGAPGQETGIVGIVSSAKFRDNEAKGYVLGLCDSVAPFIGFSNPTLALVAGNTQSPNAARLFVHYVMTPEGIAPQMDDGKMSTNVNAVLPDDEPSGIGAVIDRVFAFRAATAADDLDARQDWQDIWRQSYVR